MTEIEDTIIRAGLEEDFHVWDGQCLSIARAICDYFGGEIVFVSELPSEGFDHALVKIDGQLYDGSGNVGWAETVNRFVSREAQREDIEDHFYTPDEPVDQFGRAFNRETYWAAYQQLDFQSE